MTIGILIWVFGLIIYFIPTLVAANRKNKNTTSVFVLNFFLGWTLIGWVIALTWAVKKDDKQTATPVQNASEADELKKLSDLKEKGVLSQEEFDAKKKKILGV